MKQNKKENCPEILAVEEYINRRKETRKDEIKKEQEKNPEPFWSYSSFLLLSL